MAAGKLTTTVSTKGQVILPKSIREERCWRAGTRLTVESTPDGVLLKPSSPFPAAEPADVFASLPYRGKPKSVEEMVVDRRFVRSAKAMGLAKVRSP
ncbi:MAG: AbrB/MazE/SpoVT family DNA-binding domain-containing protein [Bradyrhizobium sp.]